MEYTGSYVRINERVQVDYVKVESKTDIDFTTAVSEYDLMQTYTILLATYNSGIVDANYLSPDNSLKGAEITVYRKTPKDLYYNYICTLTDGAFQFRDYNIMNKQFYTYLAAVMSTDSSGNTVYKIYEEEKADANGIYDEVIFDKWSICTIEPSTEENVYMKTGSTWSLGYNLEGDSISQHIAVTSWDTLGRYGQISSGIRNYDSGSFTSLLGNIGEYNRYIMPEQTRVVTEANGTQVIYGYDEDTQEWYPLNSPIFEKAIQKVDGYTEKDGVCNNPVLTLTEDAYAHEADRLIAWKEFIADGNLKLLRDTKGHGWVVAITDTSYNINRTAIGQPTTVSFSWQEVEDINKVSIIAV